MLRHPLISTLFPYTTLFRSERRRELVHPPAGGRPDRAHDVARARRRRARVVDDLAAHLDRELLATLDQRKEARRDRKSTRLNSSHVKISYAVFCLKKKNT